MNRRTAEQQRELEKLRADLGLVAAFIFGGMERAMFDKITARVLEILADLQERVGKLEGADDGDGDRKG